LISKLFAQIILAEIELGGFDDLDLHVRKTFRQIVLENRIIADDDKIAAF